MWWMPLGKSRKSGKSRLCKDFRHPQSEFLRKLKFCSFFWCRIQINNTKPWLLKNPDWGFPKSSQNLGFPAFQIFRLYGGRRVWWTSLEKLEKICFVKNYGIRIQKNILTLIFLRILTGDSQTHYKTFIFNLFLIFQWVYAYMVDQETQSFVELLNKDPKEPS